MQVLFLHLDVENKKDVLLSQNFRLDQEEKIKVLPFLAWKIVTQFVTAGIFQCIVLVFLNEIPDCLKNVSKQNIGVT